jgi:lipopolysaccharide/colanic/teichoic acid biosynthesis glycosyltransferase
MYRHVKRFLDIRFLSRAFGADSDRRRRQSRFERPAVFRQKRVGMGKRYFDIYKFRTMRTDAPQDCPPHLLARPDLYVTPVGRFLRRTSLDELPQRVNI